MCYRKCGHYKRQDFIEIEEEITTMENNL